MVYEIRSDAMVMFFQRLEIVLDGFLVVFKRYKSHGLQCFPRDDIELRVNMRFKVGCENGFCVLLSQDF